MEQKKKNYKLTIKKGSFNMVADRSSLAVINETPDGVSFEFKDGIQLLDTDYNLPGDTKQRLKLNIDKLTTGDITVDLLNYKNPVTIQFL